MMRIAVRLVLFATLWFAALPLSAATPTIGEWLYSATGLNQQSSSRAATQKPDYLAGKTKTEMCGVISRFAGPSQAAGTWEILAYDAVHHLGLAASSTDACNVALFAAPPPPTRVRSVDLSGYGTARGIRIGSTYARVLSVYGGKRRTGAHFLTAFSAPVPGERSYDNKRFVKLSEDIIVKIDNSRVSSIAVLIDLGDLT